MRIAQVAPLVEPVPPIGYGGSERIVSYITEELVSLGHEVTLFASGDSRTSARLIAPIPQSLRLSGGDQYDFNVAHALMAELVAQYAEAREFDVVHLHTDALAWSVLQRLDQPFLTTLHGRLDHPSLAMMLGGFPGVPLVSISDSQRTPVPDANWIDTIHHGLPETLYHSGDGGGGYLAFLGRMSPEKGPDLAIEIAKRAGIRLKLAAKVDVVDREYFQREIEPLLSHPLIEFIGEVTDEQKDRFLGDAVGLLFPIQWPEPFGLVMIEALACATPVIAFNAGSVPEVVRHGVTGFVVETVDEAVIAVSALSDLERANCRADFDRRFSVERMARSYIEAYTRLLKERTVSSSGR